MIINVGDTIIANHGRTGKIINIGIATEPNDIAAENDTALNAQTYDTELGYTGAVTYSNNDGTYWCYLDQIQDVVNNDNVVKFDTSWMKGSDRPF